MMKRFYILLIVLISIVYTQITVADELPMPTAQKLPVWRGFNLLEKFIKGAGDNGPFKEEDFQLISEWGFNFVRLPMDYRVWIVDGDWTRFDKQQFKEIDQAIEYGRKYNIHVCINFHRAPGYTVARPPEPANLWTDPETQRVCAMHWAHFAKRYRGIPNKYLSFNLVNEPGEISSDDYFKVAKILIDAIRNEDPDRLIISDGIRWGRDICTELKNYNIAWFTRGYTPFQFTHYRAGWVSGSDKWPNPVWPQTSNPKNIRNRQWHWNTDVKPWLAIKEQNIGVMIGEWGCYNQTPHDACLRWMEDCLQNWQKAGFGWALWNLGGAFGVLDSGRDDVEYEDFRGRKLDRKMLDLLQKY
jgi:endoglucanase